MSYAEPTSSIDVYSIITWWIFLRGCGIGEERERVVARVAVHERAEATHARHQHPVGHAEAEDLFVELGRRDRVGHEGHEVPEALVARS